MELLAAGVLGQPDQMIQQLPRQPQLTGRVGGHQIIHIERLAPGQILHKAKAANGSHLPLMQQIGQTVIMVGHLALNLGHKGRLLQMGPQLGHHRIAGTDRGFTGGILHRHKRLLGIRVE